MLQMEHVAGLLQMLLMMVLPTLDGQFWCRIIIGIGEFIQTGALGGSGRGRCALWLLWLYGKGDVDVKLAPALMFNNVIVGIIGVANTRG